MCFFQSLIVVLAAALGGKSHFLFLGADGARRRSEMAEDACVVPLRSQNQRPSTFYDVSNFSKLP